MVIRSWRATLPGTWRNGDLLIIAKIGEMMKTYYIQVKELVDSYLKFYREDLTKHDRQALRSYKGEFIHASRDTGTDLILFDNIENSKHFEWSVTFALRSSNDLFLHGFNGRVKHITREKAITIARSGAKCLAAKEANNRYLDGTHPGDMRRYYQRVLPEYIRSIPAS